MRWVAVVLATLSVVVAVRADDRPALKGPEGYWLGTLKVTPAIGLRLGFHVTKKPDGTLTATLDSLDQGARGLPLDEAEFKDGTVKFVAKKAKMSYEGKQEGDTIQGTMKQGPNELSLTLKWQEKPPPSSRPQEPKRPYPYREEEVTVENAAAKLKLAGTLTLPNGDGPFAAAVLLTGSGPQDRDESIMGHKPFLVLADHLTRKGIAVLRCDDRGFGKSTGAYQGATAADFVTDAEACVAYLKGRKEIDPKKIGLIGHSEGGMVAPLVAAKSDGVAFIVLLAGPGVLGEELLYQQGQLVAASTGADAKTLRKVREQQQMLFKAVRESKDADDARKRIAEIEKAELAKLSEKELKEYEKVKAAARAQVEMVLSPWFRHFLSYDPVPTLAKVKCPVLALNGTKDVQVSAKENLAGIDKALTAGGNKDFTVKELPGLNHLFQTSKTGAVSEYGAIDETFAPSALELVSDWIVKRMR